MSYDENEPRQAGAPLRFDWDKIRAEYEAGATQSELSRRYGCSRKAIQKHIIKENWIQDFSCAINRLTSAKVAGISASCDPAKKAAAMDAAAEKKAAVVARHKQEWEEHKQLIDKAIQERDFEMAKLAKITAETTQIRQAGERRAWGIIEGDIRPHQANAEQTAIRKGIEEAFASVGL